MDTAIYSARMSIAAIVPLKALPLSKRRLAGRLADHEREALMAALFTHVLGVCRATGTVDDVWAVVGDDAGAGLADAAGVRWLPEPAADLNAAVAHATALANAAASLVVVADLPELAVADLEMVTAAGGHGAGVVVARTHDGGTGALLRRPADVVAPAFGQASAAAHLAAARGAGVRAALLSIPGLTHDLDRPADLDRHVGVAEGSRHL